MGPWTVLEGFDAMLPEDHPDVDLLVIPSRANSASTHSSGSLGQLCFGTSKQPLELSSSTLPLCGAHPCRTHWEVLPQRHTFGGLMDVSTILATGAQAHCSRPEPPHTLQFLQRRFSTLDDLVFGPLHSCPTSVKRTSTCHRSRSSSIAIRPSASPGSTSPLAARVGVLGLQKIVQVVDARSILRATRSHPCAPAALHASSHRKGLPGWIALRRNPWDFHTLHKDRRSCAAVSRLSKNCLPQLFTLRQDRRSCGAVSRLHGLKHKSDVSSAAAHSIGRHHWRTFSQSAFHGP